MVEVIGQGIRTQQPTNSAFQSLMRKLGLGRARSLFSKEVMTELGNGKRGSREAKAGRISSFSSVPAFEAVLLFFRKDRLPSP